MGLLIKCDRMEFRNYTFTQLYYRSDPPSFLEKLKERYFIKKQNINIAITGENLSGKSYRGLYYANQFSKEIFKKPFYTSFKYETFFEFAKNPDLNNAAVLFDEIGSESRSERHWEVESQNLGEILELWGMKKCILFLTLPNWSKLSGGVKGMIHFRVHCYIEIDRGKPIYKADILRKMISYKNDKEYWRRFKTGIILDQDQETDKLYAEYFPEKVFNYNEKLAEMEKRFKKKEERERPLPIDFILKEVKIDRINRDFAKVEIMRHGYNKQRAELLLREEEIKEEIVEFHGDQLLQSAKEGYALAIQQQMNQET